MSAAISDQRFPKWTRPKRGRYHHLRRRRLRGLCIEGTIITSRAAGDVKRRRLYHWLPSSLALHSSSDQSRTFDITICYQSYALGKKCQAMVTNIGVGNTLMTHAVTEKWDRKWPMQKIWNIIFMLVILRWILIKHNCYPRHSSLDYPIHFIYAGNSESFYPTCRFYDSRAGCWGIWLLYPTRRVTTYSLPH